MPPGKSNAAGIQHMTFGNHCHIIRLFSGENNVPASHCTHEPTPWVPLLSRCHLELQPFPPFPVHHLALSIKVWMSLLDRGKGSLGEGLTADLKCSHNWHMTPRAIYTEEEEWAWQYQRNAFLVTQFWLRRGEACGPGRVLSRCDETQFPPLNLTPNCAYLPDI